VDTVVLWATGSGTREKTLVRHSPSAALRHATRELSAAINAIHARCDEGSVHTVRVASRVSRALLWSLRPWIARSLADSCTGHLKQVAAALSEVRDLDVLARLLPTAVAMQAGCDPAVTAKLRADVLRHRRKARHDLRSRLASVDWFEIRGAAVAEMQAVTKSIERRQVPGRKWRTRVRGTAEGVQRAARRAKRSEIHAVRVKAKRCRYALAACDPDKGASELSAMQRIQQAFGAYCDARMAMRWLRRDGAELEEDLRRQLRRAARSIAEREFRHIRRLFKRS